jgi:hypothetical protein
MKNYNKMALAITIDNSGNIGHLSVKCRIQMTPEDKFEDFFITPEQMFSILEELKKGIIPIKSKEIIL